MHGGVDADRTYVYAGEEDRPTRVDPYWSPETIVAVDIVQQL